MPCFFFQNGNISRPNIDVFNPKHSCKKCRQKLFKYVYAYKCFMCIVHIYFTDLQVFVTVPVPVSRVSHFLYKYAFQCSNTSCCWNQPPKRPTKLFLLFCSHWLSLLLINQAVSQLSSNPLIHEKWKLVSRFLAWKISILLMACKENVLFFVDIRFLFIKLMTCSLQWRTFA